MLQRVPPRAIAAGIRLQAVTRAGWVIAALVLAEQAVVTADYFIRAGQTQQMLIPLICIGSLAIMLVVLTRSPGWMTASAYLSVGAVCIAAYVMYFSALDITAGDIVLVGTMGTALVLAGAVTGGAIGGAAWTLAGVALSQIAVMGTQASMGLPPAPDRHALTIGTIHLGVYLLLWRSDRAQRELASTAPIEAEVLREEEERQQERRAAVVVHETVLRDLALIAHGPLQLTDFDRDRLRRDLDEIETWQTTSAGQPEHLPRDDFYEIIREFQWRGLSVDIGGNSYTLELLESSDREALFGAIRAALDNVLEHSGETSAEIFIDRGSDRLTVMVVDEGRGFDLDAVAEDRLGLRMAIIRRIEDHGGSVIVWASPGTGTSVVMSLPVPEAEGFYA